MGLVKGCVNCGEEFDYTERSDCPHCGFALDDDDDGGIEDYFVD